MTNRKSVVDSSQRTCAFGRERITLNNQGCKSFFSNYLLKGAVFGSPLFSTLWHHEIAHGTKKQTVIHVLSHRRISTLLKFGGMDATTFHKNGDVLACCAKINLMIGGRKKHCRLRN